MTKKERVDIDQDEKLRIELEKTISESKMRKQAFEHLSKALRERVYPKPNTDANGNSSR